MVGSTARRGSYALVLLAYVEVASTFSMNTGSGSGSLWARDTDGTTSAAATARNAYFMDVILPDIGPRMRYGPCDAERLRVPVLVGGAAGGCRRDPGARPRAGRAQDRARLRRRAPRPDGRARRCDARRGRHRDRCDPEGAR